MNSLQIENVLTQSSQTRDIFIGVYAANQILDIRLPETPALFVVNNQVDTLPGQHWISFYYDPKLKYFEMFDSQGKNPEYYHSWFKSIMVMNANHYKFQTRRLQETGTSTCGFFCIFYALHKSKGHSFENIVSLFNHKTTRQNEILVTDTLRMYFPHISKYM